jgi:hypothetical protein
MCVYYITRKRIMSQYELRLTLYKLQDLAEIYCLVICGNVAN